MSFAHCVYLLFLNSFFSWDNSENMFLDPERVYKMVSREAMQYNQLAMANIGK